MKQENPLIIHTEASMGWGGQEIRTITELKGMESRGFSTALFAPPTSKIYQRARQMDIPVYPVHFKSSFDLSSARQLIGLIRKLKPSVINTHSSKDSWLAGFIAKVLGVQLVVRTRHISTPIGSSFSYQHFPNLILTTSEAIKNDLISNGVTKPKISPLPTGINFDQFNFSKEQRKKIRKKHNIGDDEVLVGNICVLRSWKGLDFFLDTVVAAPENFKFILVGDGPQLETLKNKAKKLKIENRVIFTGHQEQVERYFSALDIFFFTSYESEGVPQGLLQAMATGLPLLICRLESVLEALKDLDLTHSTIDYGDVKEAARALTDLGKNISANNRSDLKTRELLKANHSIDSMLNKLVDHYASFGIKA